MRRDLGMRLLIVEHAPFVLYRRVPRQIRWCEAVIDKYDPDRFRTKFGLLKSTFTKLAECIKHSDHFDSRDQFPVDMQLAIVLYRLRTSGNLCRVSAMFGIGDGSTIRRITKRVFDAIESLTLIMWPSTEEKRLLIAQSRETLPYCLGIVDGSMSPLKWKPTFNGRFFSTYKKNYAIKWQVTCDMNKKVRHLQAVTYGAVHDASLFKMTKMYLHPEYYFDGQEYIIGDSAYPLSNKCVTPYKSNTSLVSADHRRQFNRNLSKYRVRVENCIGEIKGRFPSLKNLPVRITTQEDLDFCSLWVGVCAMLHNFAKEYDDAVMYDYEELEEGEEEEEDSDDEDTVAANNGEQKRLWLFSQMQR